MHVDDHGLTTPVTHTDILLPCAWIERRSGFVHNESRDCTFQSNFMVDGGSCGLFPAIKQFLGMIKRQLLSSCSFLRNRD